MAFIELKKGLWWCVMLNCDVTCRNKIPIPKKISLTDTQMNCLNENIVWSIHNTYSGSAMMMYIVEIIKLEILAGSQGMLLLICFENP